MSAKLPARNRSNSIHAPGINPPSMSPQLPLKSSVTERISKSAAHSGRMRDMRRLPKCVVSLKSMTHAAMRRRHAKRTKRRCCPYP